MLSWLSANAGTIIVLAVVVLLVTLAAVKIIRDKRRGRSGCSCGCTNCAMKDNCHK